MCASMQAGRQVPGPGQPAVVWSFRAPTRQRTPVAPRQQQLQMQPWHPATSRRTWGKAEPKAGRTCKKTSYSMARQAGSLGHPPLATAYVLTLGTWAPPPCSTWLPAHAPTLRISWGHCVGLLCVAGAFEMYARLIYDAYAYGYVVDACTVLPCCLRVGRQLCGHGTSGRLCRSCMPAARRIAPHRTASQARSASSPFVMSTPWINRICKGKTSAKNPTPTRTPLTCQTTVCNLPCRVQGCDSAAHKMLLRPSSQAWPPFDCGSLLLRGWREGAADPCIVKLPAR